MSSVINSQCESDVVLTGLSGRLPESDNIEEFAQQLFDGVDLVTDDDRRWPAGLHGLPKYTGKLKDLAHFDGMFFGIHDKQVHLMDPQMRLLLEVVYEAVVDAGVNPVEFRGSRTGVFVSAQPSETQQFLTADPDKVSGYEMTGCSRPMIPNRVSYAFNLHGPSYAVDTACSTSITALTLAVNAIRAGQCDAAIVAGTNLCINPTTSLAFHRLRLLSIEGRCAVFDSKASNFVRSEAIVGVLLQRRCDARRVYCTVRGVGMNTDGYKQQGIMFPSRDMQRRLALETFEEAHLRPQDVAYVEAHGTGTKVGDPEEVHAIAELFCKDRKTPLLMGSVKSNMGHGEYSSGLCSIVKIVLAMERGIIPANLHYKEPNPDIPAIVDGRIKVVDKNTPWEGGLVALNSFGFGGANAHAILEGGCGTRPPPAEYPTPRLVLASGRTDDAVERMLKLAADHPRDAELHALIDAVHSRATPGHPRRGYAVLDPTREMAPVMEVLESESEPRPVWFVFTGMGSQWAGMAKTLIRLPTFAASIARSEAALKPFDFDLQYVITDAPEAVFDNIINSVVSIVAVQVALVDILRELGVHPHGIIGHSVGELACAYADETLTAEQVVQCAYWRGRCIVDAKLAPGAMAAVGLSWEETEQRCPADIVPACHNSTDSVTVSGPPASIEKFIAEMSTEGVFARRVNSSGVAFHSKYVESAAHQLSVRLRQVIPNPKQRTARWLSSSIPQEQWSSDLAKLSSAAYFVNNMVSAVRFADVLARVPSRALVVEVAPHALLQAVLKRALPGAAHVPLVRRGVPDTLVHLLAAVGKTYMAGTLPQVSRLYPTVSWPVSRGTPALASHVGWDHSIEWTVADYKMASRGSKSIIEYDLRKPEENFIAGHVVGGRNLFPGTGYIALVWRTLTKLYDLNMEQTPVVLENVQFHRATIVPRDAPLKFLVSLFNGSGEFEVCEGGEVVATGIARITEDPDSERLSAAVLAEAEDKQDDLPALNSQDIYKELRLRGFNYKGVFCGGVKSSDARGTRGLLKWEGNWITFMDSVLQFRLIGSNTRALYLPTRLQHIVIDPAAQRSAMATAAGAGTDVVIKYYRNIDTVVSGGVEIRGIPLTPALRRIDNQTPPKLEKYVFVPFDTHSDVEGDELARMEALVAALQLVIENCGALQLKLAEPALQRPVGAIIMPYAMQVLDTEQQVRATATLAAGADSTQYSATLEPLKIKVSSKEVADGGLETENDVVLGADVLARQDGMLEALAAATSATGFVLLEESARAVDVPNTQALLADAGLALVSRMRTSSRDYLLLRRVVTVPAVRVVLEVGNDDYSWLEPLKDAMKRAESEDMRVYVWSRAPGSGALGLALSLRLEVGGDRLRFYFLPDARDAFSPDAPAYKAQVQRDLAFNVLRAGVWGTYRHMPLGDVTGTQTQVEHAYVNVLTRGDLSSLRWIESDLRHASALPQCPHADLYHVYYSSLNFRDVMLATGKLQPDTVNPLALAEQECILGFEFSGRSSTGKRVMGIVQTKGLATTVMADETFMWEVPKHWSLEEAATVPVAYATAYYALVVRGRMRRGESLLVHAGAGGVGQAAITIALHAGCNVFTTVGTNEKRTFLRNRFPQLPDANIGNSRDCSFEQLVLCRTGGHGVDLVLNSLAGDKLQASLRCLAKRGRFLEIGKLDVRANTAFGMAVLLKNTTVHGIFLDELFEDGQDQYETQEVVRCVAEGITSNVVQPLPATVFTDNQLEQSFRYMATGKHIGKVLIRIREDDVTDECTPRLQSAISRTYMHPGKSYVLVGGLGGFGLELGEWLAKNGARTLVLNSRSGVRTGYQAWSIRRWRDAGVRVLVSTADVTTPAGARVLLQAAAAIAPIGGIFNLAAVLRDSFLENLTPDDFHTSVKPKIEVTCALDLASRELAPELEHFVAFSSMTCGRGNPGQSNYALANSGMERLCEQRRADGLPALAVQWGPIGDVGLLSEDTDGRVDIQISGTIPQRIASCMKTLELLMAQPYAVVSSIVLADKRRTQEKPAMNIVQAIANILGIRDPSKVPETATMGELGVDSLMTAEIKQTLQRSYDVLLGVQEVRALTLAKLRALAGDTPPADGDSAQANDVVQSTVFNELMPKQVLVKLPSQLPNYPIDRPIFMVHPIEGVVDLLRGVAASVRGTVYGLQCAAAAPLEDMAALARFYVKHVRSAQPQPPYTLLGYSFGAGVAFEMALQLEQEGCATRLVLVDGSPAYIAMRLEQRKLSSTRTPPSELAIGQLQLLTYLGKTVYGLDSVKVVSKLQELPDWKARVDGLAELVIASGAHVTKEAVRAATEAHYRRMVIGDGYTPAARLRAPVTLFKARDNYVALDEDYGLRAVCAGELATRQLAGTHRTILAGPAAQAIADYVSDLLKTH